MSTVFEETFNIDAISFDVILSFNKAQRRFSFSVISGNLSVNLKKKITIYLFNKIFNIFSILIEIYFPGNHLH